MRLKILLLAALLILAASPSRAEPGDGDAPEDARQAVDTSAPTIEGHVGGLSDAADWYRVATLPGHVLRVMFEADPALRLDVRDDAGLATPMEWILHEGRIAGALVGPGGHARVGLIASTPVDYVVSFEHVAAPDLAIASFEIEPMPIQAPPPYQVDPITNGIQRRLHVTVANQGLLPTGGVLMLSARGFNGDPIASLPVPTLAPGETADFTVTWTATGVGDVTFRAAITLPHVDADASNNNAERAHYILVSGVLRAPLVPTEAV